MKKTFHAIVRQSNRGIRNEVLELVWTHGEFVGKGEIYMTQQSVSQQISELNAELWLLQRKMVGTSDKTEKQELALLISKCKRAQKATEKSRGVKLAVQEDVCITCMHASGKGEKNLLKRKKSRFVH